MLITTGKVSAGDWGEQSLVARFLLALIFNEFSEVNKNGHKAFRIFCERCLGFTFSRKNMNECSATVEFQANRCMGKGDKTTFDLLFTIENDWVWGVEAKYFDTLKEDQIQREVKAIENISKHLGYNNSGVLFITPEEQLGTMVKKRKDVQKCLLNSVKNKKVRVRLASWEMIFQILIETGPDGLREAIENYCIIRNQNQNYTAELSCKPKVHDYLEWEKYLKKENDIPEYVPELKNDGNIGFEKIGKSSSTVKEVFKEGPLNLVNEIIKRSKLKACARKKYVNLSKKNKAFFQLHPCKSGVDIVIRETGGKKLECEILQEKDIKELSGYFGANLKWLAGDHRFKSRPSVAFNIPPDLENDEQHEGWKEIDGLLTLLNK